MFLSIIVPVYNVEKYIRECIESILAQTFTDFELILVNDGSNDKSGIICDEYSEKDRRIKVIHKENGGQSSARKAGLEISVGEYIGFVDSDDKIKSQMYEILCNKAKNFDVDMVIGGAEYLYEDGRIKKMNGAIVSGFFDKERIQNEVYSMMLSTEPFFSFGISPSLWNKIFKRDIIISNIDVEKEVIIGEDAVIVYRCLAETRNLFIIKDAFLYVYRVIQTSITRKYKRDFYTNNIMLAREMKKIEKKIMDSQNFNKQYCEYIFYMSFNAMLNEYSDSNKSTKKEKDIDTKEYLKDKNITAVFNNFRLRKKKFHYIIITMLVKLHMYKLLGMVIIKINKMLYSRELKSKNGDY